MAKKILLCGTTGSGKTTLLRILLGLDLNNPLSNFLATSSSKTTTARIDVEINNGPYSATIEFLNEQTVHILLLESIEKARSLISENKGIQQVANALLEHPEQRFRLNYLFGSFVVSSPQENEVGDEDTDMELNRASSSPIITDLVQMLYSEQTDEEIADLALELIRNKFHDAGIRFEEWPTNMHLSSESFKEFASNIKVYTGNHYSHFGKLLTPLVKNIWLRGPFTPTGYTQESLPEWLFIDGEGLGHISSSSGSVPSTLVDIYHEADVILVIDNAAQPLQAGTQAIIKSASTLGYTNKLRLVFTHFDQVHGDNLPDVTARRNHVISSLHNFIHGIDKNVSPELAAGLKKHLLDCTSFFSYINDPQRALNGLSKKNLQELYTKFEQSPVIPTEQRLDSVVKAFVENKEIKQTTQKDAVPQFLSTEYGTMRYSHWTQVKALARRFAFKMSDEYAHMRPVSHLLQRIMEANFQGIVNWCGGNIELANKVASDMGVSLQKDIRKTLQDEFNNEWDGAYYESGKGSHARRVDGIKEIYIDAFVDSNI